MPPRKKKMVRITRKSKNLSPSTSASAAADPIPTASETSPAADATEANDGTVVGDASDPEPKAPEPSPDADSAEANDRTVVGDALDPEPELGNEPESKSSTELEPTTAVAIVADPVASEPASYDATPTHLPAAEASHGVEHAEAASAEPPSESGPKTLKRVRKVVRKKIVKKLVPKGSVTAKKETAKPQHEGTEEDLNPNSILDDNMHQEEAVALPETSEEEKTNPNADQKPEAESTVPEVEMEETEKNVSEEDVKIKEDCDRAEAKEAKEDILEIMKEGEPLESAEVMDQEAAGLSERMKRRKSEIFVGGLDRDAKEEDLRSVFGKVGEILEVRLMMDGQTGKNKGYAFLSYAEPGQAKKAVAEFSKVEICGKVCGAAAVQGNDTIFLGNIDKKWKKEDIIKLLKEVGIENIGTVTVVIDPNNKDYNRGFAFLELETNRDAQRAYKKLQKKDILGKDRNIKIAWADSFNIPDEDEMQKVKSVYIEGIPDSWDEDMLRESFKKFGEIERIVLGRNVKSAKRKDFAFVNYKTREAALSCIESFSSDELPDNGSKVNFKVTLAKRVQKVKQNKGGENSTNNNSINVIYMPGQRLATQDYSPGVLGGKRPISALGDDMHYSNLRGQPHARLDGIFRVPSSSYGMMPHGMVGSSLPYYQQQPLSAGYPAGPFYGSGSHIGTYQMTQGAPQAPPPYTSSLYQRYQK